jgi:hypothetical protein
VLSRSNIHIYIYKYVYINLCIYIIYAYIGHRPTRDSRVRTNVMDYYEFTIEITVFLNDNNIGYNIIL